MKKFKTVERTEVITLICDGCSLEACVDEGYEFREFISIEHRCGYGAIHGDGMRFTIDLCQHCFAGMCSDILTVTDPLSSQYDDSTEDALEYHSIFQAITQKKEANELTKSRNSRISARDILSINKISNTEELEIALKRVEQLWDAQYHSAEGNELHMLAGLICAYENKSWDSYFAQPPLTDESFMPERPDMLADTISQGVNVASDIVEFEANTVVDVSANVIIELNALHNEMISLFDSHEALDTWMCLELPALGGQTPITLMSTKQGRMSLKQVLNRMKCGDFC